MIHVAYYIVHLVHACSHGKKLYKKFFMEDAVLRRDMQRHVGKRGCYIFYFWLKRLQ